VNRIRQAVAASLPQSGGGVLVGFSGGLDSTVLLHAVAHAAGSAPLQALHVNHGLHPDAEAWQQHCAQVSASLGVAFVSRRVRVSRHGSLEAQARAARYRAFVEVLASGSRLFLAHHRQDQAETVLLRLVQGRGLYGMPQQRALGAGMLVRPLLEVTRADIEAYATQHALVWLDDPSNADQRLDRNFVRHSVLPELRRRWPNVEDSLLAALQRGRLADELLGARLGDLAGADALSLAALDRFGGAERVELLRLWLSARNQPAPRRAALEAFLAQLGASADRAPELAVGAWRLRRHGECVHLVPPPPDLQAYYPLPASGVLQLPHGQLRLVADPSGFVALGAVEVRFRRGGERLLNGGLHRSVKHLLQEAGVAPWLRSTYPLLYDSRGLLAVPGLAHRDASNEPAGASAMRAEWLAFAAPGRAQQTD
jgi:tRNA(Ile)-lysidine synthase